MKKEKKIFKVTARISEDQNKFISKLIKYLKAETPSEAIQYIINIAMINGE